MRRTYYKVVDGSKILIGQFIIEKRLFEFEFPHQMKRMRAQIDKKCQELDISPLSLVLYREEILDRRSYKFMPKGSKLYRYTYAPNSNVKKVTREWTY